MEFLKKRVVQQWYPNQLYGSPLNIMYTLQYGESSCNNNTKTQFYNPFTRWILKTGM